MNNKKAIGLATLTVISNGLIGHYLAPSGILLTPIVMTITTSLVCYKTNNIKIVFISALTYLFVAFNDISIKLYSGGSHDSEGLGWIQIMFFIGLLPTFGMLLSTIFRHKEETVGAKIIAVIIFIILIAGHLKLFNSLGLGRYY
jgi:hypothetical protein